MKRLLLALPLVACNSDPTAPPDTISFFSGAWSLEAPIPRVLEATGRDTLFLHKAILQVEPTSLVYGYPFAVYSDSVEHRYLHDGGRGTIPEWRTAYPDWRLTVAEARAQSDTLTLFVMVGYITSDFVFVRTGANTLRRIDYAAGPAETWTRAGASPQQ